MSDQMNSRAARRQQMENERKHGSKKKPKKNNKMIIKKILLGIVALGLAILVGGAGLFAFYASSAPDLDEKLLKDPLTSNFADMNGDIFMKFGQEKREFVPYEDIPEEMRDAILATEDVRFFKHHGMDFWRLGGAVIANFRSGFGSQGASTLTQQVIKNSFLSDQKTLKRKAQEAWLAFKLEREYKKEEIFEMYFNKILMGGLVHGFGTAADSFYGKRLDELELHEMAMLAGLPQSPNGYNPFKNPERAEKRRNIVLGLMYKHDKITKEEMEAAIAIPVTQTLLPEDQRKDTQNSKYLAYVDIVLDELEAAGMTDLLSEGVTIQTALDPKAQQSVENAINTANYESEEMQAGMTVLNTKTGEIVAIGGGRNYSGRNLNFASGDNQRQPGSIIKPILSYGPIIENESWSTGQIVVDEPYKYKGTDVSIQNVDGKYHGAMTIREALYKSRNIPAVKIFEESGTKKAGAFANKLGFNYEKMDSSNSLGGGSYEVSTMQMAGAYAAFGNGGIYTKPHAVKKVILRDGKTERGLTPDPVAAMKDSTAYMITDILRDVISMGTGKTANVQGLDMAGKTGTTNYSSDQKQKYNLKNSDVPDSWFTGYTTEYTISVWGGYKDYVTPIRSTGEGGRAVPQTLFRTVMTELVAGRTTPHFKQPSSVEEARIIKGSNPIILAGNTIPDDMTSKELFVRGTLPTEIEEKEVLTEIEAPTGLSANYDESSQSISLQWSHNAPDEELFDGAVQFDVFVAVDGSEEQKMTSTEENSVTFSGAEPGRTYVFRVIARAGDLESSPASTSLLIEEQIEEPEIDEEEFEDDPYDDQNENNNGNNGNNGNNNNNNSGNNNGNNNNGDNGNNNGSSDGSTGNDGSNSGTGGTEPGAGGNTDGTDDSGDE